MISAGSGQSIKWRCVQGTLWQECLSNGVVIHGVGNSQREGILFNYAILLGYLTPFQLKYSNYWEITQKRV